MEVKRKDMQRSDWIKAIDKKYIVSEFDFMDMTGVISLSVWNKLPEPVIVTARKRDLKIVDDGYKWIQMAPRDKNFWVTAMYDDKDNLIEIYIDINNGNVFDDVNNPHFYDMFSDIIIAANGEVRIVDQNELIVALTNSYIDEIEYEKARKATGEVFSFLEKNGNNLIDFCSREIKRLESLEE